MKNRIIQDYGKTVTPELYMSTLQGHQYIPQSDQSILNIIRRYRETVWGKKIEPMHIIDVGCGPGRLTHKIGAMGPEYFTYGIDVSKAFISYAKEHNPDGNMGFFVQENFAKPPVNSYIPTTEIIVMQGVMHHIHNEDRAKFLQRSYDLLKKDGILIIGDEFIKNYKSEEDRIVNVANFYLHIIDEARKGGFNELAEEEAKNLIDDCFFGTKYAGHATEKTFEYIYDYAQTINQMFYDCGSLPGVYNQIQNMFRSIKESIEHTDSSASFNRGDYKVSIDVFTYEVCQYGFLLKEKYEIGPVQQLGGMGVLVFSKK